LSEGARPAEWRNTIRVGADFFDVLGVHAEVGRTFGPGDEIRGNDRVLVITHALWRDRFEGATNVIGRSVRCDGEMFDIVGVLPASAYDRRMFGNAGIFRPLGLIDEEKVDRTRPFLTVLGRRDLGVSAKQGRAFVESFGARLAAEFPRENAETGWRCKGLHESTVQASALGLTLMLLSLSGFVLLIACCNLTNLLLARAVARAREFAVRAALGASNPQLLRPLVVESMILAGVGGVVALFASATASNWFRAQALRSGDLPFELRMDWRVLAFAFLVSGVAILSFSIAPALFTTRLRLNEALKSGSRGSSPGRGHERLRQVLVVGQFALAMVLLAGAGFFVRGSDNLLRQSPGWIAANVVEGSIQLPASRYAGEGRVSAFCAQARERLAALPGAQSACLGYSLPYGGLGASSRFVPEGRRESPARSEPPVMVNGVTPSFFDVTATPLLAGRFFTDKDSSKAARVVIVSKGLAQALFPNQDPVGRRVADAESTPSQWAEIVGVVADVHSMDVSTGLGEFQLYQPIAQNEWHDGDGKPAVIFLAVRFLGTLSQAMVKSIQSAMNEIDPDLPVRDLIPATTMVERTTAYTDLMRRLLIAFALLGLFLAAIGIYGVIARLVALRTGEIGVRMALGAKSMDVMRLVLGSGIRLALSGAVVGTVGGIGLTRVLGSLLPGMQTDGAPVMVGTTVVLVGCAVVACWLPARRAARINPITALRTE